MLNPLFQLALAAASSVIEKSAAGFIRRNALVQRSLSEVSGTTLRASITDTPLYLDIRFHDLGVAVTRDDLIQPDILISGPLGAYSSLVLHGLKDPFEIEGLNVSGDFALAQKLFSLYKGIEFDFEEELAQVLGDIPARSLGIALRWMTGELGDGGQRESFRRWMIEDAGLLPANDRVEQFMSDVDTLRADLDRLAVRVERVSKAIDQ